MLTESVVSTDSGGLQDLFCRGFVGEIAQFLHCVATREQLSCSAADNAATGVPTQTLPITAASAKF